MAAPQNVELEAAKFLHKLIQESKDEPTKLATKLYVVRKSFFFLVIIFSERSFVASYLLYVGFADTATHEIKWKRKFNAISSDIKVKDLHNFIHTSQEKFRILFCYIGKGFIF